MRPILVILIATVISPLAKSNTVSESLTFFKSDGLAFTTYNTTRTSGSRYNLFLPKLKQAEQSQEKALSNYLYIFPNNYGWDINSEKNYNLLKFRQGDHATLVQGSYEGTKQIAIDAKGIYKLKTWDGKQKTSRGNFGNWTSGGFSQYARVFDFPDNFEIVSYKSNRQGVWKLRHNTLSFFANGVNNVTFEIEYRLKSQQTFESLETALNDVEAEVKQIGDGVQVTLGSQLLFSSGSARLSKEGMSVLNQLIGSIKQNDKQIVIEGHTDNVAISGALAKVFPTNWELSSARSLTILHYFIKSGIVANRLESRAFGSIKPVADNNTAEGRAKNRRIEIKLIEKPG